MSVHIKPCNRCPLREGCDHRMVLRERASGLGARSIHFDCPVLEGRVQPGVRIRISIPKVVEDGRSEWPDYCVISKLVSATITSVRSDYSFGCIVDPGEIDPEEIPEGKDINLLRFRRNQPHTRIKAFLDEPRMTFCELGSLLRDGACDVSSGECQCGQFGNLGEPA